MRMEHKKSALELSHCKITGTKPRNFKVPNRRALQSQRKSRSGFVFYGNIDPFDIYRSCRVRRVEFQLACQFPRGQCASRIVEPQKCRHGHLKSRRNMLLLLICSFTRRLEGCGQRRPNTGNAVAIAQTAHFDIRCRNEVGQAVASPNEIVLVEINSKLAEWQLEHPASRHWLLIYHRGTRERLVVNIRRPSQTWINHSWRCAVFPRKKKRVSVDGSSEVIGFVAALSGMGKRKLCQRKETILITFRSQRGMHLGKRFLWFVLEALVELEIHQLPRRKRARPSSGKNVRRLQLISLSRANELNADGRGAARHQQRPHEQMNPAPRQTQLQRSRGQRVSNHKRSVMLHHHLTVLALFRKNPSRRRWRLSRQKFRAHKKSLHQANATSSFASFSSDPLNIVPLSVLFDIDKLLLSFPAFSTPDHQSIHLLEQSLVITHDILHLTVLCDDLIIERK